ncbi:MAG: M20/M25/M40 family metallo-hydrolase, partial [Parvularculaceae bacterium]
MKKVALFIVLGMVGLVIIAVGRTVVLFPGVSDEASAQAAPVTPRQFEAGAAPAHLAEAISYPTISWGPGREIDEKAFEGFAAFLMRAYPNVSRVMERRVVNGHALVYRWKGADPSKKPIGFLAHIDVVPVEPGTEERWTHPPFEGVVADGKVWGRGALDDKGSLISIMEAAERLATSGFAPSRDIYFLFGHDEEVSGKAGAGEIRKLIDAEGVQFAFTIDEGSGVVDGLVPGAKRPVALIATSEKGFLSLKFSAEGAGGHSSAPGPETAVSLVARAVVAVEDNPFPLKIDANTVAFLHALAPEMPLSKRL